ncbi:MAG: hypothetical protein M3198_09350, partial [Actinomycetota bacterium]|nr:hypothetical protein [Actinomycetota bacterium]
IGTGLRDVGSGVREGVEDFVGFGKGVVVGTVEAGGEAVNAAFSCATDFSGCRENVGGFASAVWSDPFGVASAMVGEAIDEAVTKIRQGHIGEAAGMFAGFGKYKAFSKIDDAVRAVTTGTRAFEIHPRVIGQLADPRLGILAGRLAPDDLQSLLNNPGARRFIDTRGDYNTINVIQEVEGRLIRITTPADAFRIISVEPIRPNQVTNRIASGDFVPIPYR